MTNSVTSCFLNEGISKKYGECYKDKGNFKPEISSIFYFELVNDGEISHMLVCKNSTTGVTLTSCVV